MLLSKIYHFFQTCSRLLTDQCFECGSSQIFVYRVKKAYCLECGAKN